MKPYLASGLRLGLAAALGAALTACDAPRVPGRTTAYAFTTETGTPRVLHWPVGGVVHVYAVPAAGGTSGSELAAALDAATALWNAAALYGEFRLDRVTSPSRADVVVAWSDAALPVDVSGCLPRLAGYGVTTFCLSADSSGLATFPQVTGGAGRTKMVVTMLAAMRGNDPETRRILAHELGHALGLLRHSTNPADLMYPNPVVDSPSAADRASVELLYHTSADVAP